jgi:predicted enzyme related to lactoylglutathione lyase
MDEVRNRRLDRAQQRGNLAVSTCHEIRRTKMDDQTQTAVNRLSAVIIPVADQDQALQFYTEVLGLDKRADIDFGPGRWIEVAPSSADTPIALCPPGPGVDPGNKETGISLETDDINAFHSRLAGADVDVDAEVGDFGEAVPPTFWFRDPEGNQLMVVEAR